MRKELPARKNMRLKGYDYSSAGAYFLTFCVKDMHEMLGSVVVGCAALGAPYVKLSEYGDIVNTQLKQSAVYHDTIRIDKFVVMPNHVHVLVYILKDGNLLCVEDGAPRAAHPTRALIPDFIRIIKRKTNKIYGFNMWQTSYYDHIIRSEAAYQRIWTYIDENPVKWTEDCYYTK